MCRDVGAPDALQARFDPAVHDLDHDSALPDRRSMVTARASVCVNSFQ